jgi:hypothetical protein
MNNALIYINKNLPHPLSDVEYDGLNEVWSFIKIFKSGSGIDKKYIVARNVVDYRLGLINSIKSIYKPDEFFVLEATVNKLIWNLRDKLYHHYFSDNKKYNIANFGCKIIQYSDVKNKLKPEYFSGHINKIFVPFFDKKRNIHIIKRIPDNEFNILTSFILTNRNIYEKIMIKPMEYKNIEPIKPNYFEFDYPFPNIHYCQYQIGSNSDRLNRIKKYYYHDGEKVDKWWYKFIDISTVIKNIYNKIAYTDEKLAYPLSNVEYDGLNEVWSFIDGFNLNYSHNEDEVIELPPDDALIYRHEIIYYINTHYSYDEFFVIESVVNKLFWNLRNKIYPLYFKTNKIDINNFGCKVDDLNDQLNISSGGFQLNKLFVPFIDKNNNLKVITRKKNIHFNLLTGFILHHQNLYEKIMVNPNEIYNIKTVNKHSSGLNIEPVKKICDIKLNELPYFEHDYPYPNIHFCKYQIGTNSDRLDRIKKYYYKTENMEEAWGVNDEKWWHTLIILDE